MPLRSPTPCDCGYYDRDKQHSCEPGLRDQIGRLQQIVVAQEETMQVMNETIDKMNMVINNYEQAFESENAEAIDGSND